MQCLEVRGAVRPL